MCDPEGVYTFKNGNEYRGSFRTCSRLTSKYGIFEGEGKLKISDLGTFNGKFLNNQIHGLGTYFYKDGRKYVGEFKNGEMDGQGTFTEIDGTILTGQWKNDKFIK